MSTLRKKDAPADPLDLFGIWYDAVFEPGAEQSTAATLATCGEGGRPSIRVVLLKAYGPRGFVFFTNYRSRKARDLEANPQAALCFFWAAFGRQLRIEGRVKKAGEQESDDYFATRDRSSQIGAWASEQSSVLPDRESLELRVAEVEERFSGETHVPRPPHWGGYRLEPDVFEFWQGQPNRLHDRLRYSRDAQGGWDMDRLAP